MKFFTAVFIISFASNLAALCQPCPGVDLLVSFSTTDIDCFNGVTGNLTPDATGGSAPYTYQWSTGSTASQINSQLTGLYCLTVTDVNGCSVEACDSINGFALPLTTSLCPVIPQCNGDCLNTILVTVHDGTPPFQFVWNDGSTEEDRDSLCAGFYEFTITDSVGSSYVGTHVPFADPDSLLVDVTVVDATCTSFCDGSISLSINGGSPPYLINLNGAEDASAFDLCAGVYPYEVLDELGCLVTGTLLVDEPAAPIVNVSGEDSVVVSDTSAYGASFFPDMFYSWLVSDSGATISGQGTSQVTVLWSDTGQNSLIVFITDSIGCASSSDTFTVNVYLPSGIGIGKLLPSFNFWVYPNPALGHTGLNVAADGTSGSTLWIYNADGRLIQTKAFSPFKGNRHRVDLENFAAGVYTFELRSHQGVARQRVIVYR